MIMVHLHKYSMIIGHVYLQQRNEKIKEELVQKKAALLRQLYILKNPVVIKQFVIERLNMQNIALQKVKRIYVAQK
jgi:hypothetical protein